MKKIYLLLILITGLAQAQIVNIPDANFKNFLLTAYTIDSDFSGTADTDADINNDGEIQVTEALAVDWLEMSGLGISDLTGLTAFTNMMELRVDANNLSSIDLTGLTQMRTLDVSYNQLTTLNLSGMPLLWRVEANNNSLGSISFSGMTGLSELYIGDNQITSLDISGLPGLNNLTCYGNQLTSLDVSGRNMLNLDCEGNLLTSLNLSNSTFTYLTMGNETLMNVDLSTTNVTSVFNCNSANLATLNLMPSALTKIDCSFSFFETLDFSGFPHLKNLSVQSNQLTSLNVSGLTELESLNCATNQLTTLNLEGLSSLAYLFCHGNLLTSIAIPDSSGFRKITCQNNNLEYVSLKNGYTSNGTPPLPIQNNFSNNPNLQYICADENEINIIQTDLNFFGPPGVVVNSYCTFNPGGDYNTITGNLTHDQNGNGCDAVDTDFPYIKMNINNGTSQGMTFSRNDGDYTFFTGIGNFTVTPDIENPTFFSTSPANTVVNFADNNNNVSTNDFCISANGIHNDLEIVIAPVGPARPGFNAKYTVVYKNKGNQAMSLPNGIILQYDNNVLDFVSASEPISGQGTDSLNWDYVNLMPFETRTINVIFSVNAPTDIPAVNINDTLPFTVGISPNNNDENIADNGFTYLQTVVGSFDPNDITCIEGTAVSSVEIGNYLHYIINFENTGTYPAENIVVKEVIDVTKFDLSSLRILTTTHDMEVKLTGNVLEMIFKNIQLGPSEHGSILLKIRSNQSLVTGDSVQKSANIYFDYNFPIATNVATTIFTSLSIGDTIKDDSLSIYPNPASDVINIDSASRIRSLELFDAQGRLLMVETSSDTKSKLDISNYTTGIYYVRISTETGIKTQKIIKN